MICVLIIIRSHNWAQRIATAQCLRMQYACQWVMANVSLGMHTLISHCITLQHTATHCNTLQHTATHYNTLQHITTHCSTLQHTATHCNTLWYITYLSPQKCLGMHTHISHCNTLQHTTPHCNTLQHTATHSVVHYIHLSPQKYLGSHTHISYCNTLQQTTTHCNTLHTPEPPKVFGHAYTHLTLQHAATHYNTVQHITYLSPQKCFGTVSAFTDEKRHPICSWLVCVYIYIYTYVCVYIYSCQPLQTRSTILSVLDWYVCICACTHMWVYIWK